MQKPIDHCCHHACASQTDWASGFCVTCVFCVLLSLFITFNPDSLRRSVTQCKT
ncbi:hypothetical protein HETIRDRAFT_169785 [Heterobasidion irregulare TC 32-1]|uniref:Uncharacterized protein n=1 Tax=Heterobasidion irregulare (strain TC 32-1) TaxID=747525 RepID=W4K6S1_HETIT|nr:uncharacterized protein HETIRDRAFT_169785 [Heterobasidion irregulare TC 32-1]ETW81040.1 hypothetical protein HETIRDRAFT_169785 [Heterobasidion irregulare TC 32-1]